MRNESLKVLDETSKILYNTVRNLPKLPDCYSRDCFSHARSNLGVGESGEWQVGKLEIELEYIVQTSLAARLDIESLYRAASSQVAKDRKKGKSAAAKAAERALLPKKKAAKGKGADKQKVPLEPDQEPVTFKCLRFHYSLRCCKTPFMGL